MSGALVWVQEPHDLHHTALIDGVAVGWMQQSHASAPAYSNKWYGAVVFTDPPSIPAGLNQHAIGAWHSETVAEARAEFERRWLVWQAQQVERALTEDEGPAPFSNWIPPGR